MSCMCPLQLAFPVLPLETFRSLWPGWFVRGEGGKNLAKGKFSLQTVSRWCLGPISSWPLHVCITQGRSASPSLRSGVLAFPAFWLQHYLFTSMTPLEPVKGLHLPALGLQTSTWQSNSLIPDSHIRQGVQKCVWKGFVKLRLVYVPL